MAIDQTELTAAPAPELLSEPAPTTLEAGATPASPLPEERSSRIPEPFRRFFHRGDNAGGVAADAAVVDATPRGAPVVPEPVVAPSPPPPAPYLAFENEDQVKRFLQSQTDQEIARRKELERQREIATYEEQIATAHRNGQTWEAGELAGRLHDLKEGAKSELSLVEQERARRTQLDDSHTQGRLSAAAELDQAYMNPVLSPLAPAMKNELLTWHQAQVQEGKVDGVTLRANFAERASQALYAQGRDDQLADVFTKLDPAKPGYDPEFRKLLTAQLNGGLTEPPAISGSPTNTVHYDTLEELREAHAHELVTNEEFRTLVGRFA